MALLLTLLSSPDRLGMWMAYAGLFALTRTAFSLRVKLAVRLPEGDDQDVANRVALGLLIVLGMTFLAPASAFAADRKSRDIGNGFKDHGIATPSSQLRGTVTTTDGEGNPVALSWLMDHRGGYSLLMLDLTNGRSEQFGTPWKNDSPFATILSTRNRLYTHCGGWFVEFDPVHRAITFSERTTPRAAMSMAEDDSGVIWSAAYPQNGVVSYDPNSQTLREYGNVHKRNWKQYPRSIATDKAGWVYLGIGFADAQIIILDPQSGKVTQVVLPGERRHGRAVVERDNNGKVYGHYKDSWWELYEGRANRIRGPRKINRISTIAGTQNLFHRRTETGFELTSLDLIKRQARVKTADGELRLLPFDYETAGAQIMGVSEAPNGKVIGGTAFPMRFFSYDPGKEQWENRDVRGQWNALASTDKSVFVGEYSGGILREWNPFAEWSPPSAGRTQSNPEFLYEAKPSINRPHDLIVHPDDGTVILAGTPGYGLIGGGLLLWDSKRNLPSIIEHADLLSWHSASALAALANRHLLVGTTIAAGTGGESEATEAQLYILNLKTGTVDWHAPVLKQVTSYNDMMRVSDDMIYGFADRARFFVFDTRRRKVLHEEDVSKRFGKTTSGQQSRVFIESPDGRIFALFRKGVAEVIPDSYEIKMMAESPVAISVGGAWLADRIYFASGSRLYSWNVPVPPRAADQ